MTPNWSRPDVPVGLALVVRPKLAGPGMHFGVLVETATGSLVLDLQPDGVRFVEVTAFDPNKQGRIVKHVPDDQLEAATARLEQVCNLRIEYRLLAQNCEHFARWVVDGAATSWQSLVAVALTGAAAVTWGPSIMKELEDLLSTSCPPKRLRASPAANKPNGGKKRRR